MLIVGWGFKMRVQSEGADADWLRVQMMIDGGFILRVQMMIDRRFGCLLIQGSYWGFRVRVQMLIGWGCSRWLIEGSKHFMQTLIIYKLGLNPKYYTLILTLLVKIVLCRRFPCTKFIDYQCFDMRLRAHLLRQQHLWQWSLLHKFFNITEWRTCCVVNFIARKTWLNFLFI